MAIAAPAAAAAKKAAAKKTAAKKTAAGAKPAAAGKGKAAADLPELPERGSWKKRAQDGGGAKKKTAKPGVLKIGSGSQGTYRRALVAEFIVCMLLLGLSPLAKKSGEMGPVRFMKRGTATAALFVILGLTSSIGTGAARASAMFGGLVTLVLLVDQREAFGRMATILTDQPGDETDTDPTGVGPDESTDAGPDVVET